MEKRGEESNILIKLNTVSVRYSGGAFGLTDVDLDVIRGKAMAVLGELGAGKSSLLRAIAGFLPAERVVVNGEIRLRSANIGHLSVTQRSKMGIVLVPERHKLPASLSGTEIIRMLMGNKRTPELVGTIENDYKLLKGALDKPCGLLSGGQRQMLAIAIAFCRPWTLLLIDEPFLGLTPALSEEIADILGKKASQLNNSGENDNGSIIVTMESPISLNMFDGVINIGRGKILEYAG